MRLLAAMLLLPIIAVMLRIRGYQKTQAMLASTVPAKPKNSAANAEQLTQSHTIARLVSIAANHGPYRANCLKKSLLTWWWLAMRGIATDVTFGVNRDNSDFNAHAWVTLDGHVLLDTADVTERFTPLQI